jgi:hypothetical protein
MGRSRRSAFTLIEAVAVVLVLALIVPPTLGWMQGTAARRADAVAAMRATTLATAVVETVMADVASSAPGMGFAALATPATYIDTPVVGLRARLASVTGVYEAQGLTYTVEIGALVNSSLAVDADAALNLFRVVTVRVTAPSATGAPFEIVVPVVVGAAS